MYRNGEKVETEKVVEISEDFAEALNQNPEAKMNYEGRFYRKKGLCKMDYGRKEICNQNGQD